MRLGEPEAPPVDFPELRCYGLRAPASARRRTTRRLRRAVVAEIGLLCAAAGIRIGQAHRRALPLAHFFAAVVTNKHRLSSHDISSRAACTARSLTTNRGVNLGRRARAANSPRPQQREERLLFEIKLDITSTHDS
jgi:hypothetical protein